MHLQMSEFVNGRYGGMKPKEKARRKSFVRKASEISKKYPNDKTEKGRFIKDKLYTEYGPRLRNRENRALKLLYENDVELEDPPDWVKKVGTIINTAKYTILGGGLKDIILWQDYAYTFYVTKNEKNPEKNWQYLTKYEEHLVKLSEIFGKLNEKTRARLNYAEGDNIYATTFKMLEKGETGRDIDRRLVITRVPLCNQGTLMDYIGTWGKKLGVEAFATMVYETTKVLRILHDSEVYVLDIKPDNIFVCPDPRKKGYDGYTFSFGDLDMAQICNRFFGYKGCQKKLATLFFLPTNAIANPNKQRNLYGVHGYTIRDGYALSKTLLLAFNMIFRPQEIFLFDENKFDDWMEPRDQLEARVWKKYKKQKEKTQAIRYAQYMTQDMANEEWELKMDGVKERLMLLAKSISNKLVPVIELLFELMYQTSNSGRPVIWKTTYDKRGRPVADAFRLKNWDEMVDIETIHYLMDEAKDKARNAGATTFKRNTWFGEFEEMNMQVLSPMESVEETNVEDMCWSGYSRVKGTRAYSKGSCRRSGGRRKGGRRRRRFKEELKF